MHTHTSTCRYFDLIHLISCVFSLLFFFFCFFLRRNKSNWKQTRLFNCTNKKCVHMVVCVCVSLSHVVKRTEKNIITYSRCWLFWEHVVCVCECVYACVCVCVRARIWKRNSKRALFIIEPVCRAGDGGWQLAWLGRNCVSYAIYTHYTHYYIHINLRCFRLTVCACVCVHTTERQRKKRTKKKKIKGENEIKCTYGSVCVSANTNITI